MRSYIGPGALAASAMLFSAMLFSAMPLAADEPSVLDVSASANADGTYAFHATVSHRDEGWKHYVDKWEIVTPEGQVIGTRTLYHPHVDEQPFTRSLSRVAVPIGTTQVTVHAYCNVTGVGARTFTVKLPPRK